MLKKSCYTVDMPYLYAHTLLGLTVRERLDAPLCALLHGQEAAYFLGLLGPDVYFFDRLPPPLLRKNEKRTGNALHDAPATAVFSALLPLAAGDEALHAYALGFLCHYALDCAAHPFVCSQYAGYDHTRFEMRIDLPLCHRLQKPALCAVSPARLFACAARQRGLVEAVDALHWRFAQAVCGRGGRGVYRRSFRNFLLVHRLLYDPLGRKRRFLARLERLLRQRPGILSHFVPAPGQADDGDLFNEGHAPWASPWEPGRIRTESFFDLFDAALSDAAALLPLFAQALEGGDMAPLLIKLEGGSMAHGKPL